MSHATLDWTDSRGLLVVLSVLFLTTAPLGFMWPYRTFWGRMLLLKPNHVLGLVMVPMVFGSVAQIHGSGRLKLLQKGLLLGFLSWVFVIHWAFVCFTFLVYLFLRKLLMRDGLRREGIRLGIIVLISALFVAPAIYFLLKYFPATLTLARGTYPETPLRSDWGDLLPPYTSLLFLVTLDQGIVFYLGVIGVVGWLRKKRRKPLLWAAAVLGAYVLWGINYLLYLTARAREADEFYYFLLFVLAVAAGNGAYAIITTVARWIDGEWLDRGSRATAAALGLVLLIGLPYWWRPVDMDVHFRQAQETIPSHVTNVTNWIRRETAGTDTLLASDELYQWIPALSGRPVIVASQQVLDQLSRLATRSASPADGGDALPSRVKYVVYDLHMEEDVGAPGSAFETRPGFELVFRTGHTRIFRLRPLNGGGRFR